MTRLVIAALLLFSACAFSQSQPPAPTPSKPVNPPQQSAGQPTTPSSYDQGVTIKAPVSVQLLSTGISPEERAQEAQAKKDKTTREWWAIWLNAGYVFLTLILASVTSLLWHNARDTAKKELRAYIGSENIMVVPHDDPRTQSPQCEYFLVMINNFGKTPAHNMAVWTTVTTTPKQGDVTFPISYGAPIVQGQLLHAGQRASYSKMIDRKEIQQTDFDGAVKESPTINLFFVGKVEYADIYGRRWRTKFCYRWEPTGIWPHTLRAYKEHNNEEYLGKA